MRIATTNEDQLMDQISFRLAQRNPQASAEEISRIVHEEHHKLEGRPVRTYVSVLVERSAKQRLHGAASVTAS